MTIHLLVCRYLRNRNCDSLLLWRSLQRALKVFPEYAPMFFSSRCRKTLEIRRYYPPCTIFNRTHPFPIYIIQMGNGQPKLVLGLVTVTKVTKIPTDELSQHYHEHRIESIDILRNRSYYNPDCGYLYAWEISMPIKYVPEVCYVTNSRGPIEVMDVSNIYLRNTVCIMWTCILAFFYVSSMEQNAPKTTRQHDGR